MCKKSIQFFLRTLKRIKRNVMKKDAKISIELFYIFFGLVKRVCFGRKLKFKRPLTN
jgi:hypothetical protein